MYRNILIATDGSNSRKWLSRMECRWQNRAGAKVTALIVEASFNVFGVPESQVRQMPEAFAKHAEHMKQHATKVLNHVADAAKAAGVACEWFSSKTISPIKRSSKRQRTRVAI